MEMNCFFLFGRKRMRLELENIEKSFGEKKVLQGISFAADSGSAFGLLGRNGAGKTTTIRILMDVFPADGGRVLMDGKPIDYANIGIGYLPEERGLYPKKKIIDQLVYFAQLKGMRYADAVASIDYWLGRLQMEEHRNKRLDTLSKGNQQKIQLITALAHDPDIVILDEPFSGLDPVNAMLLKDVVKEEIAKGKIVLFSSHQMNYIEEFCDAIAILNGGHIALCGNLREIKHNYTRDKLVVRSQQAKEICGTSGLSAELLENGEVLVKLPSPEDKKQVMRQLTESYDIDEIRVYEPSLNDIFVEYAGDNGKIVSNDL
jgi:ABC-2 type transport system ATP-binding protein